MTIFVFLLGQISGWGFPLVDDLVPIPDPAFKLWLLARYDTNRDQQLQQSEAQSIYQVTIESREIEIHDLDGLQHFPNLFKLAVSVNQQIRLPDLTPLDRLWSINLDCPLIQAWPKWPPRLFTLSIGRVNLEDHDFTSATPVTKLILTDVSWEWVKAPRSTQTFEINGVSRLPVIYGTGIISVRVNAPIRSLRGLPRGIRALNLVQVRLHSLEALRYFTELESLRLSSPHFTQLQGALPTQLERLRLVDMESLQQVRFTVGQGTSLVIEECPVLTTIETEGASPFRVDISDCPSLQDVSFHEGLTSLRIDHSGLTRLPTLPTSVRSVYLSRSRLTELPDLDHLTNLNTLNLYGNDITSIAALPPNLSSLTLSRNPLHALPDLKNLPHLFSVTADYCGLYDATGIRWSSLSQLSLTGNQLYRIPDISKNTELSFISLWDNPLLQRCDDLNQAFERGFELVSQGVDDLHINMDGPCEAETRLMEPLHYAWLEPMGDGAVLFWEGGALRDHNPDEVHVLGPSQPLLAGPLVETGTVMGDLNLAEGEPVVLQNTKVPSGAIRPVYVQPRISAEWIYVVPRVLTAPNWWTRICLFNPHDEPVNVRIMADGGAVEDEWEWTLVPGESHVLDTGSGDLQDVLWLTISSSKLLDASLAHGVIGGTAAAEVRLSPLRATQGTLMFDANPDVHTEVSLANPHSEPCEVEFKVFHVEGLRLDRWTEQVSPGRSRVITTDRRSRFERSSHWLRWTSNQPVQLIGYSYHPKGHFMSLARSPRPAQTRALDFSTTMGRWQLLQPGERLNRVDVFEGGDRHFWVRPKEQTFVDGATELKLSDSGPSAWSFDIPTHMQRLQSSGTDDDRAYETYELASHPGRHFRSGGFAARPHESAFLQLCQTGSGTTTVTVTAIDRVGVYLPQSQVIEMQSQTERELDIQDIDWGGSVSALLIETDGAGQLIARRVMRDTRHTTERGLTLIPIN